MFPALKKPPCNHHALRACRAKGVGLPDATISSQPQEVQQEEPPTWTAGADNLRAVDENTRSNCYCYGDSMEEVMGVPGYLLSSILDRD